MRSIAAFLLTTSALAVGAAPAMASRTVVKPTVLTIVVGKHGVAGGPKKLTVKKGTRVVLVVRSVIKDGVHLHGYDIERPVKNGVARIVFTAKLTGVFEIELESRGLLIGRLTVK
jgi:hypothetical protein